VEISALDDPLVISIIAADANIVIRDRTCGGEIELKLKLRRRSA
jgi:hypothetical protein